MRLQIVLETDKSRSCFRHGWIQGQDVWSDLSSVLQHGLSTQAGALQGEVLKAPPSLPPSLRPATHPEERKPPFPNSSTFSLELTLSQETLLIQPALLQGVGVGEGSFPKGKPGSSPQQKGHWFPGWHGPLLPPGLSVSGEETGHSG